LNESVAQKTQTAPSILIILMGSLGDIARGLCLVSHLKAHLSQSRISWLVEPKWAELIRLHNQIDRVIVFQRAWRFSALRQLSADLAQDHFDLTLDLQRILKSGFFSLLSGSKRRIGFHRRNAKELNWIFNNEHIDYYSDDLPKIRHYLKFTEYLGLPPPATLEFGLSSLSTAVTAPPAVSALQDPFIAVVLGASWASKEWLFDGYRHLVEHILSTRELSVVLVGDHTQAAMAKELSASVNQPGLINLVGRTTLRELTAVLKAAAVGTGPDSGPAHLAAAVRTPFVTLFGPTSPRRTAPFGCEHLVVKSELSCSPCYQKRCPDLNKLCMARITAEQVAEKVFEALGQAPAPEH
jgi:ADP-heptose:LPS heptosyltransferase